MDGIDRLRGRSWICPVLLLAVLTAVALRLGSTLPAAPRFVSSDDGYYLRYMQQVHAEGLAVFPRLFDWWNGEEVHWIYPPPSRVGYVAASALAAAILGPEMRTLACLSLGSHIALVLVSWAFARRHFGEPKALFVAALLACSTILMGTSRLALTDSFIALWMCLSVWLFLEAVLDPGSARRRILFMVAFAFTILVKELSVLLALPFAAFLLVERYLRSEPLGLPRFLLALALPPLGAALVMVLAAGGASGLFETLRIVMASPATNDYAIRYGSGPWYRYLIDYLCLSPWPTLLAIGYFAVLAIRLRAGEYDRRLTLLGLVAAGMLFELGFFTKNARYAVVLELPICVFAVSMLAELTRSSRPLRSAVLCGALVAALCFADWRSFEWMYVRWPGYDPITAYLIHVRGMNGQPGVK